jgi:hypothetical protein
VADDRRRRGSGRRLTTRVERLTDRRRNTERRKVRHRYQANRQQLGLATVNARLDPLQRAGRGHHRCERAVLLELQELLIGGEAPLPEKGTSADTSRTGIGQDDELVRIPDRQAVHEHAVQQTEDRGVGADAKRQREHRDRRESRAGRENAARMTKVLLNHVAMLLQRGCRQIEERPRPGAGLGKTAVASAGVTQLLGERVDHLAAVLVTKLGRIAPEERTVDVGGAHAYSLRGMSLVARACSSSSPKRLASATATSRPRRVSR